MTLVPSPASSEPSVVISPWSTHGLRVRAFQAAITPASTAWPNANRAYYVPFYLSAPALAVEMFFVAGTSPGTANFDLGIYRDDFTRLVSLGATASANTTDATLPVGGGDIADTYLMPGRYYMAMSSAATSITCRTANLGVGFQRALGYQMQETAHPLPTTATPISCGTSVFIPPVHVALITNVL